MNRYRKSGSVDDQRSKNIYRNCHSQENNYLVPARVVRKH